MLLKPNQKLSYHSANRREVLCHWLRYRKRSIHISTSVIQIRTFYQTCVVIGQPRTTEILHLFNNMPANSCKCNKHTLTESTQCWCFFFLTFQVVAPTASDSSLTDR